MHQITVSPQYVKQKLMKLKGEEIKCQTKIVNFYNLLSTVDRISRQNINKELKNFENTINQGDLPDICITLHTK